MGHPHGTKNIRLAFALNASFMVVEAIGGFIIGSTAILSHALHDLGDSITLGLSWYLQKKSDQKRTSSFSYGYRRFSLLGALINAIVLVVGSIIIFIEVLPRITDPGSPNAGGMLLIAGAGFLVNGFAALRTKRGKSMNERMVTLHLFEDVLSWGVILIVGLLIQIGDLVVLDPILSLIITVYILYSVFRNLKKTVKIFLQAVPESVSIEKIESKIKTIKGIISVHDIHVWSLDGEHNILTMHIVVPKKTSQKEMLQIKCRARDSVCNYDIEHATVEVELEGESCDLDEC